MCGLSFTKQVLGNDGVPCDSLPRAQLRSPSSHRGPHLLVLSATPCQNPPQEAAKGETRFQDPHFALFRAQTELGFHILTIQGLKIPGSCSSYSSLKKLVLLRAEQLFSRPWSNSFSFSL